MLKIQLISLFLLDETSPKTENNTKTEDKPTSKAVPEESTTQQNPPTTSRIGTFSRFSSKSMFQTGSGAQKLSDLLSKKIQNNDANIYQTTSDKININNKETNSSSNILETTKSDVNNKDSMVTKNLVVGQSRNTRKKLDFLSYINQPVFTEDNPSPFIDCSVYKTDQENRETTIEKCKYRIKNAVCDFVGKNSVLEFNLERVKNPAKKKGLRQSVFEHT